MSEEDTQIFEKQIGDYVDVIFKNLPENAPSILYHYTDGSGLKSILETRSLWLSDIFSMNDPSEIRHGIEIAKEQFEIACRSGLKEDTAKKFSDAFFEPALSKINETANYFICCFSASGDDLGQWRSYADDGHGFALGFDGPALDKLFSSQIKDSNHTFPISYDEELLRHNQGGLANIFVKSLNDRLEKKISMDDWINYTMGALLISFLYKHKGYYNEQEYRFMHLFPNDDAVNPKLKHRLRKNKKREHSLAAYQEFDWRTEGLTLLREIVVGPAVDFETARTFIENCLKAYGFDKSKVTIKRSEIPYRS